MSEEKKLRLMFEQPSTEIGPNGRLHWTRKFAQVRKLRQKCKLLTLQVLHAYPEFSGFRPKTYDIEWFYTYGVEPDEDNILGRCKGMLDGIADALKMDDRLWHFGNIVRTKVSASDPFSGKVVLIFKAAEA